MSDMNQQAAALDDIDTYTGLTIEDTAYTLTSLEAGDAGPYLQHMTRNLLSKEH